MRAVPPSLLAAALALAPCAGPAAEPDSYVPGPDSVVQPGVPQGELITFDFADSKVFPGTTRQVTVYVPRQYDPAKPACVYVDQDGVQWNAPVVLDNLIARGEIPVMVGIFVTPGVVPALDPSKALNRYNRSFEYDGLGDGYSKLILGEILPRVETKATADGRPIHLSHSGNDRAIAGSSSGAIAAFTVAWEHPEAFSRVLSSVGTYIGLRGGERYPTLIRKYEPKPIRVFLQDGTGDLNIYAGDWWMANQTMERALTFAGYEVNHVWGDGAHNGKHIAAILPDALRWLWKDWPKAVQRGVSKNGALSALLIPGEDWKVAADGLGAAAEPASDGHGDVYFEDISAKNSYKLGVHGDLTKAFRPDDGMPFHQFGPDGRLYVSTGSSVVVEESDGKRSTVADGFASCDLVVAHNGNLYVTDPGSGDIPSRVWLVLPDKSKQVVDTGLRLATGVTLSPDQSLLYVADAGSHWIYSYQIQPDGTLANKQRYYWLHTSDTEDASNAGGMCCDRNGWLYVATALGIQVCDQAGRVNAILPMPHGRPTSLCFGGERFDTLFASCADTVFRRKLNAVGASAWDQPSLPPVPKL